MHEPKERAAFGERRHWLRLQCNILSNAAPGPDGDRFRRNVVHVALAQRLEPEASSGEAQDVHCSSWSKTPPAFGMRFVRRDLPQLMRLPSAAQWLEAAEGIG